MATIFFFLPLFADDRGRTAELVTPETAADNRNRRSVNLIVVSRHAVDEGKSAVVEPMPSASVATATAAKPGVLTKILIA